MMDNCPFCAIIEGKAASKKIYEDEKIIAILDLNPANVGHVLVMPKEHYPIIEQVPDPLVDALFKIANRISMTVFETLKAEGTNIIVTNGIAAGQKAAHFMVHIIPRAQNDNINFNWKPKQLSEEEMSTVELKLKEQAKKIGEFEREKPKPIVIEDKTEKIPEKIGKEENYLIKQLERIP
ncbi:HIT domain-containing protein [Candidatus Woesearchaeota archaeon]|nr:HIT domain-containing protein [Candidatus Woesearchaeota archaeon]